MMGKKICEVCWEEIPVRRCSICGRAVCGAHIYGDLCTICRGFICSICRRHLAIASCMECGRIACYHCLDRRYNINICMMCRIKKPP